MIAPHMFVFLLVNHFILWLSRGLYESSSICERDAERSSPIRAASSLYAISCFRFTEIAGEPFWGKIGIILGAVPCRKSVFVDGLSTR